MFYVLRDDKDFLLIDSVVVNYMVDDVSGQLYIKRFYIFELIDKYASYETIVDDYGYKVPNLPYDLNDEQKVMLKELNHFVYDENIYPGEEIQMDLPEKYFVAEINEEDLEVAEKWLIRVSVIEEKVEETNVEELVNRKLVFELIAKIVDGYDEALKLDFEVAKLPILYLTDAQKKLLMSEGKFELDVLDRVKRAKAVKEA